MLDLDMNPYGVFVWGAYAVTAGVLVGLSLRTWLAARAARRALDQAEAGE